MAIRLVTLGHGTLPQGGFVDVLHAGGVESLVDVRTAPGSRRHPHFRREAMQDWVQAAGVAYRWEPRLGGLRKPSPDSPNVALRHSGFRAYADHMTAPEFAVAIDEVLAEAATRPTTVMCAESVWWRCHRRLIAELLHARGHEVIHLLKPGHSDRHRPWEPISETRDGVLHLCGEPVA